MKCIVIVIIFSFLNCKAQSPIIALETWKGEEQANAYYKDINNVLDTFVGTWIYTNDNTSFKIVLRKKPMYFNNVCYEDIIVGEYQFIENGVEKVNTLTNLNDTSIGAYDHHLGGNLIYNDCKYLPSDDCVEGEKRLDIGYVDALKPYTGALVLHKRVVNGQEAIKATMTLSGEMSINPDTDLPRPLPTIPLLDELVFIKQ
ncbi:DUF6705 family protein [Gaetbulibacter sp. PBL-D1]|uniref:DUF6705 family protein n=1 Tax=Gaetbulibacter sp. PBL-D1 TaxID=3422594 RepID=UPI003D2EC28C